MDSQLLLNKPIREYQITLKSLSSNDDRQFFELFQQLSDPPQIEMISQIQNPFFVTNNNQQISSKRKQSNNEISLDFSDYMSDNQFISEDIMIKKKGRKRKSSHQIKKRINVSNQRARNDQISKLKRYNEVLQIKNKELQKQVEKLQKVNKINKQFIRKIYEKEHVINGFFIGKQQLYQKISFLMQDKEAKEKMHNKNQNILKEICVEKNQEMEKKMMEDKQYSEKLIECINTLRLRQGSYGIDRLKAINYYFKELVQSFLPDLQKYIIKTAQEQSDIFNRSHLLLQQTQNEAYLSLQQWRIQMLEKMQVKESQFESIYTIRSQVIQAKKVFDNLLTTFYELKCQLCNQSRKIQAIFDRFHNSLSETQIGYCLCYLQKYRYKKGISTGYGQIIQKLTAESYHYDERNPFNPQKR